MAKTATFIDVPLEYPVPVQAADGKSAERSSIRIFRPKTRHAKNLAVVVGPDLLKGLFAEGEIDKDQMANDIIAALVTADRLDGLTEIVADMCGEEVDLIDDLDLVDLFKLGTAFVGFFPALLSLKAGE